MSSDLEARSLMIGGLKVQFPCKPYPSQFGMMDKVIRGIERRQNCLLESPTGSGKSLALLCSALAWQSAQHEKITKALLEDEKGIEECACQKEKSVTPGKDGDKMINYTQSVKDNMDLSHLHHSDIKGNTSCDPMLIPDDDDDFDDFQTSSKLKTPAQRRGHITVSYDDTPSNAGVNLEDTSPDKACCVCSEDAVTSRPKKQKVPKIYFGTRTHKQISQITRELKRTAYHDVRMAILASREFTCVHPQVKKMKNKNEGCRERLDPMGPGCNFQERSKRIFLHQHQLQQNGLSTAWDIEEFVGVCLSKRACPYFVTRNIREQADIIFCPYNYLMDPLVRGSMEINLKDQIVILDEAHNIEDSAREAASATLTTEDMTYAISNLQDLLNNDGNHGKYSDHLQLKTMMESLLRFTEDSCRNLDNRDYDQSYKVFYGFDMAARLKTIGLGADVYGAHKSCLDRVTAQEENDQTGGRSQDEKHKMSIQTEKTLETLFQVLDYMYRNDMAFVEDYRVTILRSVSYQSRRDTNNQWLNRRDGNRAPVPEVILSLNFWCMNPAVAFSDFKVARNIVLSSGTLSPMSSFQSELGVTFHLQLEASHVIQDKQVWVGALGSGPKGQTLQAVYKQMETFTFQDELGDLIYQICMTVPHGVLCFLPSYRALEKFTGRWKQTQLFDKLSKRKRIMMEPRASDRSNFEAIMKDFYDVISGDTHSHEDCTEVDGAIFFAVCRGKVSEGLDFADNNARAVITVGIPYPSIKDLQVSLKRAYNDNHMKVKGLLSGNDWYEIQAYRALNQALGRCIRHRKDWGALILVDDRFRRQTTKYCKGLSKWVRSKVNTFESFSESRTSLSEFTQRMVQENLLELNPSACVSVTPTKSSHDQSYVNGEHCIQVTPRQELDSSINDTQDKPSNLAVGPGTPFQQNYSIFTPFSKSNNGAKAAEHGKPFPQRVFNKKSESNSPEESESHLNSSQKNTNQIKGETNMQVKPDPECIGSPIHQTVPEKSPHAEVEQKLSAVVRQPAVSDNSHPPPSVGSKRPLFKKFLIQKRKAEDSIDSHIASKQAAFDDGSGATTKVKVIAVTLPSNDKTVSKLRDREPVETKNHSKTSDMAEESLTQLIQNVEQSFLEGEIKRQPDVVNEELRKEKTLHKEDKMDLVLETKDSEKKNFPRKPLKENVYNRRKSLEEVGDSDSEEFLKTRRKSGKKRLSLTSKEKKRSHAVKKTDLRGDNINNNLIHAEVAPPGTARVVSHEVVTHDAKKCLDGSDTEPLDDVDGLPQPENKYAFSSKHLQNDTPKNQTHVVRCKLCRTVLVQDQEFERQKRKMFLRRILGDKASDIILFFKHFKMADAFCIVEMKVNGITLNSFWDDVSQSSLQYLQCKSCSKVSGDSAEVIGVRVMTTPNDPGYNADQMWLLPEMVTFKSFKDRKRSTDT